MKNKNNPKSKKLARQSRALKRFVRALTNPGTWASEAYIKSQIAALEAKGVK